MIARTSTGAGTNTKTVIVGCGPAGLAIAGRLRKLGEEFVILERDDRVAPTWHRHYERLQLHTVKETSNLPHRSFPTEYPRYVPREKLVDYYQGYRREMQIEPRFGCEVVRIERNHQGWLTTTRDGDRWLSRHVVVCSGYNRKPVVPTWPGQDAFAGEIAHTRRYRSARPYRGSCVLVVGMGNTGAEIALDLVEHEARPTISVRGPVNIIPRDVFGRPAQKTAELLCRLPGPVLDTLSRLLRRATIGDLTRWGIRTPKIAPIDQLQEQGKTPVIDVGTVREIKAGRIRVRPAVEDFDDRGVRFADGRVETFDHVILATGYVPDIGDFVVDTEGLLNDLGHPGVISPGRRHRGLHLLGFDAYSPGGVLKSIRDQSAGVAEAIVGRS